MVFYCMYLPHFYLTHSDFDKHLAGFHFLATVNVAIDLGIENSFEVSDLNLSGYAYAHGRAG